MAYRYSVTKCPSCGNGLVALDGVIVVGACEGFEDTYIPSELSNTGVLNDVFDIIERGLHSDTLCGKCEDSLYPYEEDVGDEDLCDECGEALSDGEGYDGLCGPCADEAEAEGKFE